jgi:hypothetical protein
MALTVNIARTFCVALLLAVLVSVAACSTSDFDLMAIERVSPKGRIQDPPVDPEMAKILEAGKDAIPELIELISSPNKYDHRPVNFWPEYSEGDMALAILSDLFRDSTWTKTTLPNLCWGTILGWTNADTEAGLAAWDVSYRYVEEYGRESLTEKWREAYSGYSKSIYWDDHERFFKVRGKPLEPCKINTLGDPTE